MRFALAKQHAQRAAVARGGFPAILGQAMLDRGLNTGQMAKCIGDHAPMISDYLRGIRLPSKRVWANLAEFLGETPESLMKKAGVSRVVCSKTKEQDRERRALANAQDASLAAKGSIYKGELTFRPRITIVPETDGKMKLEIFGVWELPVEVAHEVSLILMQHASAPQKMTDNTAIAPI